MTFRASPDFQQPALFPADALEAVIRIGWVPERRHMQVQLEAADATYDVLLMLKSVPTVRPVTLDSYLRVVTELATDLWFAQIDPEPF